MEKHTRDRTAGSPAEGVTDVVGPPVVSAPPSPPRQAEYGLRVSLDQHPPNDPPSAAEEPPAPRRRRSLLLGLVAAGLAALAVAAVALVTHGSGARDNSRSAAAAPQTSHAPPAFAPAIAIVARVARADGVVVTPARDGGLWYQTAKSDLTRLAAGSGRVAYAFPAHGAARGLVVVGRVVETPTRAALVERDRGVGRVVRSIALPSPPVCCGPLVAAGALWMPLSSGLARVELTSGAVTVQPAGSVVDLAGDDSRLWLLAGGSLLPVDTVSGRAGAAVALGGLDADAIAVGADAVWLTGAQGGRPVVVRLDPDTGARQIAVPLPAAATAVAVVDGAVWLAMPGVGVQELDPSTNALAGRPIAVARPVSLLAAGDDLWVVGRHGAAAIFTRLDLRPSQR